MSGRLRVGLALILGAGLCVPAIRTEAAPAPLVAPAAGPLRADASLCADTAPIPGFSPAVSKYKPAPVFPDIDASNDSEGWVRIGFTISAEGETKDVVVLDRVGSKRMLSAATSAVKNWEYEPATLNGQPADQYGNTVEILYEVQAGQSRAVHANVIELYDRGRGLVGSGKYAEGIEALESATEMRLNLFEQAMISFALAYAYSQSGNPQQALPYIRHAMIEDGKFLERRIANPAKRLRIRLESQAGNVRYVACAPSLAETDDFDPKGADRKDLERIISGATAALRSATPLVQSVTIPAGRSGDDTAAWKYDLTRHKFSFASVNGTLSKFRANCVVHVVEDEAKAGQQWATPAAAGPCTLYVYGAPGTTFRLIEDR